MIITFSHKGRRYRSDTDAPNDISVPLGAVGQSPSAWYVDPVEINPVMTKEFTGSVKDGGSVNFRNIKFNPHGNGTHTECLGHITPEVFSVNRLMKKWFSYARLISVNPEKGCNDPLYCSADDRIISLACIQAALGDDIPEALIIRTLPNPPEKARKNWSNSNWPQLERRAAEWMAQNGILHLLIDLPSIDRENDGGKLLSHHAFWKVPGAPRKNATITELIYVPDNIDDGPYLLELQVAPFENDAAPSRPVLYRIVEI